MPDADDDRLRGGILTLDVSTVTGWAVAGPAFRPPASLLELGRLEISLQLVRSGSRAASKRDTSIGRVVAQYVQWLEGVVDRYQPRMIVFEAPIMPEGRDPLTGKIRSNITTKRKLYTLAGVTEAVAFDRSIACFEEQPSTIKKFWTGHGKAEKNRMIAVARQWGYDPIDDNEADALALLHYTLSFLDQQQRRVS